MQVLPYEMCIRDREYASQVMYDYKEKALSLLASLPDTEVKVALAAVSYTHLTGRAAVHTGILL